MTASRSERVYDLLLHAYPADFRAAYGREMTLVFRDLVRERGAATADLWLEIVCDMARTAPTLRADSLRAHWNPNLRVEDGRMKPMGILAVLIGLVQTAGAVVELTAPTVFPVYTVLLAVAVGILLVVAGIALVRRSPRAAQLSTVAAVSWLALVAITRVVHPWMSIFSMLLGVVFPLTLLGFLWAKRDGRGMTA
jgi:hypothetical protein